MSFSRIAGLILLVVGIIILVFGINSSQVVTEQVMEGVTGRFTQTTMLYIIVGTVLIIGGGILGFWNRPK